jgi:hypothetical protein
MLDNYHLQAKFQPTDLALKISRILKTAYLLARGRLLIPTIDLVQSKPLNANYMTIEELVHTDDIWFCGEHNIVSKWIEHKNRHFQKTGLYGRYRDPKLLEALVVISNYFLRRNRPSTIDVGQRWKAAVEALYNDPQSRHPSVQRFSAAYLQVADMMSMAEFIQQIDTVPDRLQGRAFLWNVIQSQGLVSFALPEKVTYNIELLLGSLWLNSHLDEYVDAVVLTDLEDLGTLDCDLKTSRRDATLNYKALNRILWHYGLSETISSLQPAHLYSLKQDPAYQYFREHIWLQGYWTRIGKIQSNGIFLKPGVLEKANKILEETDASAHQSSDNFQSVVNAIHHLSDEYANLSDVDHGHPRFPTKFSTQNVVDTSSASEIVPSADLLTGSMVDARSIGKVAQRVMIGPDHPNGEIQADSNDQ